MTRVAITVYLSLLWRCANALPTGPEALLNITSRSIDEVETLATYSLIDSYDASNWLSRFDLHDVSHAKTVAQGHH